MYVCVFSCPCVVDVMGRCCVCDHRTEECVCACGAAKWNCSVTRRSYTPPVSLMNPSSKKRRTRRRCKQTTNHKRQIFIRPTRSRSSALHLIPFLSFTCTPFQSPSFPFTVLCFATFPLTHHTTPHHTNSLTYFARPHLPLDIPIKLLNNTLSRSQRRGHEDDHVAPHKEHLDRAPGGLFLLCIWGGIV